MSTIADRPWSELQAASAAVLKAWDAGEPFDRDEYPETAELMERLAAATARVDETLAAQADATQDAMAALRLVIRAAEVDDEDDAGSRAWVTAFNAVKAVLDL